MKLSEPGAKARWRAFARRARLALMDVDALHRRSLLADLEAHVEEALSRQTAELSEQERLERALSRVGDPVQFLRPMLDEKVLHQSSRKWRMRALLALCRGLLSAVAALALVAFGSTSLACPDRAGLFRLDADEYQVRMLCEVPRGIAVGAPWLAIATVFAGGFLLWLAWRNARRVRAILLLRGDDP